MDMFLAICWTIALLGNIFCCVVGSEPNWVVVFAPLVMVVFNAWDKVLKNSPKR